MILTRPGFLVSAKRIIDLAKSKAEQTTDSIYLRKSMLKDYNTAMNKLNTELSNGNAFRFEATVNPYSFGPILNKIDHSMRNSNIIMFDGRRIKENLSRWCQQILSLVDFTNTPDCVHRIKELLSTKIVFKERILSGTMNLHKIGCAEIVSFLRRHVNNTGVPVFEHDEIIPVVIENIDDVNLHIILQSVVRNSRRMSAHRRSLTNIFLMAVFYHDLSVLSEFIFDKLWQGNCWKTMIRHLPDKKI
ncbi:hypothetical protein M153_3200006198 [Pseudoloma neurophilia]|uniref:Uncharacterized protein n=1 Tax=Pseudoloma neurophilia TaxID=146866 RepID=A0A0R0M295_9MICR|nr:hypothetical protein M153_3200006198 [Pseudoloma neurophilia]